MLHATIYIFNTITIFLLRKIIGSSMFVDENTLYNIDPIKQDINANWNKYSQNVDKFVDDFVTITTGLPIPAKLKLIDSIVKLDPIDTNDVLDWDAGVFNGFIVTLLGCICEIIEFGTMRLLLLSRVIVIVDGDVFGIL